MQDGLDKLEARARLGAATVLWDRLLHDLKQPLNLIRVTAQDLRLDSRKGRLQLDSVPGSMEEIVSAVDQAVSSIDRLQLFATPTRADSRVDASGVDEVCRAALGRIHGAYPDVEIAERYEPNLPPTTGDPFHLEQAVWELLDNAVRAALQAVPKRPQIEISARQRDHDVVVEVRDNGGGVPQELRSRIFEPFFTTCPEGAGLGLALAVALVSEVGGRVALAGSDAEGTVVEVFLPGGV